MTITRWILLRMKNVTYKTCIEHQNTHFMFTDFFPEKRAFYEIMSKNMVQPERTQTIKRLRVAYWIKQAYTRASTRRRSCTHTHVPIHPRTSARGRMRMASPTHAHTLIALHGNSVSWTRFNVTSHVHCLSVLFNLLIWNSRWQRQAAYDTFILRRIGAVILVFTYIYFSWVLNTSRKIHWI